MKQAIETKVLGPTNHRGSRVKAMAGGVLSVTVAWDYSVSPEVNHECAAKLLCEKYNWSTNLIGGATAKGFVFVQAERNSK